MKLLFSNGNIIEKSYYDLIKNTTNCLLCVYGRNNVNPHRINSLCKKCMQPVNYYVYNKTKFIRSEIVKYIKEG
jgi:hypothetical protein